MKSLLIVVCVVYTISSVVIFKTAVAVQTNTCAAGGCPDYDQPGPAPCIRRDDIPTMQELIQLNIPTQRKSPIKIRDMIGKDYTDIGTCLLNDKHGNVIEEIKHDHKLATDIVNEMFRRWIQGNAQETSVKTNTWSELVKCLRFAELMNLASDVESVICSSKDSSSWEGVESDRAYYKGKVTGGKGQLRSLKFVDEANDHNYIKFSAEWASQCGISLTMPFEVPSIVDKENFWNVVNHITAVCQLNNAIVNTSNVAETFMHNFSVRLNSIMKRLTDGKIRVGVVGLTKAGKSTTLDALLGQMCLPGSVQPQTAKEVTIVHSDNTDSVLYGEKENVSDHLETGCEAIHDRLLKINRASRNNIHTGYDKLHLYAPLIFLTNKVQGVRFEVSDTPGLGEAGSEHFAIDSELAVRDMCAFVIIMKLDFLKTISEKDLLRNLSALHPKLFSNLNRILILINAYELSYEDKSNHNLQPDEIQQYVSEYLREPNVLGKVIPHEHIIPFSALWGLRARMWLSNPRALLDDQDARNLFREAWIVLDRAGYDVNALKGERNEEKVRNISLLLEDFSRITKVESSLTRMLYDHGATVILNSAIDDTLSVVDSLRTEVAQMIVREDIANKENVVNIVTNRLKLYQETVSKYINMINELDFFVESSTRPTVSTLADSLEEALHGIVNRKLYETLQDTREHENRSHVQSRILTAKSSILSPATTKMKMEWLKVTEYVGKAMIKQTKTMLSEFKAELLSSFNGAYYYDDSDEEMKQLVHELSMVMSEKLNYVYDTASSFVSQHSSQEFDFHPAYEGEDSERVADSALTQLLIKSKMTKYKLKSEKQCFGRRYGFFGPEDCVRVTVAEPYDVATYSPDLLHIQAEFSAVVKRWLNMFSAKVNAYQTKLCVSVVNQFRNAVESALTLPTQKLEEYVKSKEAALNQSNSLIEFLTIKKNELNEAEMDLDSLFG